MDDAARVEVFDGENDFGDVKTSDVLGMEGRRCGYFVEKAFVDDMLKERSALAKSGDEIKLKFTGDCSKVHYRVFERSKRGKLKTGGGVGTARGAREVHNSPLSPTSSTSC